MITYQPGTEEEFFEAMPPRVYKYRVWSNSYHKKMLTDLELFFPEPKKFNDPYDCGLPFRPDPTDKDPKKIKDKLEELAPRAFPLLRNDPIALEQKVVEQLSLIMQDPDTYFQEQWGFKRDDLNSIYGVLSLTPHPANFLMWSHYSDSHRGFVIGFDTKILVKQNFATFSKVKYTDEIPIISVLEMNSILMYKLIYTKASPWAYEDEYRFTRIMQPNSKITANPSTLKTVHLGFNMPQKDKFEIIEIVKEKYPTVNIFEMTLGKDKFELIPFPLY